MSSSDRTSIKKYNAMNNQFSSKSSGNETTKKKINVIRNVSNNDIFGITIEKTWFKIPITNTNVSACANATIQSSIITTPIIYKIPNMTIPLAVKLRKTPNILSFEISDITTSQIVLMYSGIYFTNVSISRDDVPIATGIIGNKYTDSGLTINTSYTYIITPYDFCNGACDKGISSSAIIQSTLPDITTTSTSGATSQIILAYTGNYTTVSISRNGTYIATYITGTSYTDSGLTGNTSYTYIVTPYNSSGNAGTTATITQKTLPNITSLNTSDITDTQIVLEYTGYYTTVSIYRDGTDISTNVTDTTYTDSGLTGNTSYIYIITPYDSSGNAGNTATIRQKTLPNITSLSTSSFTDTQIVLEYTGNYTTVSISRDGTDISTNVIDTTYTDTGLTGNTSYIYIITPYDSSGNAGSTATITQKTLPNITSLSTSSFTDSQIILTYDGSFTNMSISRDGTDISTNVTDTTYTDSGLIGNTSYTYIITPYDSSGNAGTTATITQKTLPNITSLSTSGYTDIAIVLEYIGNYTTVSISRDGTDISTNVIDTTYTDSGLTGNTSYTYIITPYDSSGNAGTTATITQKTLPNLTTLSISSFTDTQIVLEYDGSFTNVSISRNGTDISTNVTDTTYTDSGLNANTSYIYIVTPYDSSGNAGSTSTITQKTLPNINALGVSSFTDTQIVLAYAGSFTTVSISRNGTDISTNVTDITYTDSGLNANTSYTYIITPYDSSGNAGSTATITPKTLSIITSFSTSGITDSQIILAYTGNYTAVSISRNGTDISTNVTDTTYTDSGLTGNTSYIYIVTPYDSSGNAGITATITQKTLSELTALSVSSFTDTQIVLSYDGGFTKVSISRDGIDISTNVTDTTYTDSGLTGNTSYTYIFTPYDSSDNAGSTATITQKTLPNLTTLSISSFTDTQIVLEYTGKYTTVSISRDSTEIATGITDTTYTDSGLTTNTSYTYIITPYDSSNIAGTTETIIQSTL
jgi:hypothetical protein